MPASRERSSNRGTSSRRESHAGSSTRFSKRAAQPSVTALSPKRRSSTESSGDVWAKCSVCPASWKRALQSSLPPMGWMTSITRPGTSIGEQNARGDLSGRCSTSRCTFCCARRSMPRSPSVASSAGTMRSAGKCASQPGARSTRATSQRRASSSPSPMRSRNSRSADST